MGINFTERFKSYLFEKEGIKNFSDEDVKFGDAALFQLYANRFKEYVSENSDLPIFNEGFSLEDLKSLSISEDGLLTAPEDNENLSIFSEYFNGLMTDETFKKSMDYDNDGEFTIDDFTAYLDEADADSSLIFDIDEMTASFEAKTKPEAKENEVKEDEANEDKIKEALNSFYATTEVIKALDEDNDGKLSDSEKTKFEKYVKETYDDGLTSENISKVLETIKDGTFSYDKKVDEVIEDAEQAEESEDKTKDNTEDKTKDIEKPKETKKDTKTTEQTQNTSNPGNSVSDSGGSHNSYDSGNDNNNNNNGNDNGADTKDIKNMSLEQLETEHGVRENNLSEAQKKLDALYDGSDNEAVKEAQGNYDEAKAAYETALKDDKKVSAELKKTQAQNLSDIETKQSEIVETQKSIVDTETEEARLTSEISAKDTQLGELSSTLSELEGAKSKTDDTTEIQSKIDALQQKQREVEQEKADLQAKKDELPDVNELKNTLTTQQNELKDLETARTQIEADILKSCSDDTKKALEDFNKAKTALEEAKTPKESDITAAKSAVATALSDLKEVNSAIADKKAEKDKKDFSPSSVEKVVDFAKQYDDMTEAQMSEIMRNAGYAFNPGGWCADFVAFAYGEGVGYENVPEWYANIENKSSPWDVSNAGKEAGKLIDLKDAQAGDIIIVSHGGGADHIVIYCGETQDGTYLAVDGNTGYDSAHNHNAVVDVHYRKQSEIYQVISMH
ncbi:hypothetical protein IKQ26_07305 [bacterium]|nr:hypothetical protein [bacterium]